MKPSAYYDPALLARETQAGRHRAAIGGLWEELGELQLAFLQERGLQAEHTLLDIGCGALRLGVKATEYLKPAHYFGADISIELVEAGYAQELNDELRAKLPRKNLHITEDFDFSFLPAPVDVAIAQSVFTHLPFNHIRHCLAKLAPHVKTGGYFFATAWVLPNEHKVWSPYTQPGSLEGNPIITTDIADSYHYSEADFIYAVKELPWRMQLLGDWNHPRGQQMLIFTKEG